MHFIILLVIVCVLLGLFLWSVLKTKRTSKPNPNPETIYGRVQTQALKDLARLEELKQSKDYFKKLYEIVTTLSEIEKLEVLESKYQGRGWFVKATVNKLFRNDYVQSAVFYPSHSYGKGSGMSHFPLRYLKTREEAEEIKNRVLEARVQDLKRDLRIDIERVTLWED